jgi:hypothetical protein
MAHKLIIDVAEDGSQLTLETGPTFAVAPADIPTAICWYATQRVTVAKAKGSYRITNLDTYGEQSIAAQPA